MRLHEQGACPATIEVVDLRWCSAAARRRRRRSARRASARRACRAASVSAVIRSEIAVYVLSSVELPLASARVEAASTSNESWPNGALICL